MKQKWRHILFALGLTSCVAMLAPACVFTARVRPVHIVEEEPPPPRYQTVQPRAGYVWVRGRWQWIGGRWKWKSGHWVRARSGHVWHPGQWERRGNRHHWIQGRWAVGTAPAPGPRVRDHRTPAPAPTPRVRDHRTPAPAAYPTAAPPAPRYVTKAPRAGYVWVRGRYEWNGRWNWKAGHWERAKANKNWQPGHWERRGNRYVWVEGRWVAGPRVRDHRR